MPHDAIGMIETKGLLAAIEAADKIAKISNVEFIGKKVSGENFSTLFMKGNLADVKTAIEAASTIFSQKNELIASYAIPCPHSEIMNLLLSNVNVSLNINSSLGLLETKGLTGAITAADIMLKTAEIGIMGLEHTIGAPVILKIEGEYEHVKSALEAGMEASRKVRQFVRTLILPHIDEKIKFLICDAGIINNSEKKVELTTKIQTRKKNKTSVLKTKINIEKEKHADKETVPLNMKIEGITEKKSSRNNTDNSQHDLFETKASSIIPKQDLINTDIPKDINKIPLQAEEENSRVASGIEMPNLKYTDIEKLSVSKLRRLAREFENFPIKGRIISMANRNVLLEHFGKMLP